MRPHMDNVTLYSSSRGSPTASLPRQARPRVPLSAPDPARATPAPAAATPPPRLRTFIRRHKLLLAAAAAASITLVLVLIHAALSPLPRRITQRDIDAAVLHTLKNKTLPSPAVKAYEAVRASVVRVRGLELDPDGDEETDKSVGSGVVIVEKGIILTNLHVVAGAKLVKVVFADGLQSEAAIIAVQPENDLAVLQAKTVPDDL